MTARCPHCSTPLTLTLAAEHAKERPKFVFELGDVVTHHFHDTKYIYRGGKCGSFTYADDIAKPYWDDSPRVSQEVTLTRPEIISHLDSLGFDAVFPDDKPEPAKVAEPEVDRHGRKIIKREGHAMIVETDKSPHDLRCCTISDLSGDLWFACDEPKWHKEHSPKTCVYLLGEAMENLSKAAATPLPSEKPAEAKVPFPDLSAALEAAWPDKSNPQPGSPRWTVELEQRIQDLNARLAKVEGKNGNS